MSHISTILAAILCATAPVASSEVVETKTEQSESNYQLGKETVSVIRTAYEKGQYKDFLSEMDSSYKSADLSSLIDTRQKQIPLEFQEEWEAQFLALQKEKNQELLSAISDEDESIFAQKVRSLAADLSTPEQEKAVSKLNSFIAMAPQSGANDDENTLINIDLEYEYKILHAQMPMSDLNPLKSQEYQIALRMEKMDKMVAASKNFQDHDLKQAVGLAAANLDARLARNLDGADLNALVKGKAKPANATEEKVHSILSSYQGQFSDLMKELGNANR